MDRIEPKHEVLERLNQTADQLFASEKRLLARIRCLRSAMEDLLTSHEALVVLCQGAGLRVPSSAGPVHGRAVAALFDQRGDRA